MSRPFVGHLGLGSYFNFCDSFVINIGEVAPRGGRARHTSRTFVMSTLGALVALWLGLLLTTEATPWPTGLPFALAGSGFATAGRWMYGIAVIRGLLGIGLRTRLPRRPRWLLARARRVGARAPRHGVLAAGSTPYATDARGPVGRGRA